MSTPVFKKLNLKDEELIVVLDSPDSFEAELAELSEVKILRSVPKKGGVDFALAFVKTKAKLDLAAAKLAAASVGDVKLWFAYPKKSSKRYSCDFDRDNGWDVIGEAGFEPVRVVAIDEDWSALRFRRTEHIKTMTRTALHRISEAGKEREGRG